MLLDGSGDLLGNKRVRLACLISNDVDEVRELVDPVLLEHVQVLRNYPLLNRVEGHVVGLSPRVADPVIDGAGCHVQCVCNVLPEAVTHLVARLSDVTRTAIFG